MITQISRSIFPLDIILTRLDLCINPCGSRQQQEASFYIARPLFGSLFISFLSTYEWQIILSPDQNTYPSVKCGCLGSLYVRIIFFRMRRLASEVVVFTNLTILSLPWKTISHSCYCSCESGNVRSSNR